MINARRPTLLAIPQLVQPLFSFRKVQHMFSLFSNSNPVLPLNGDLSLFGQRPLIAVRNKAGVYERETDLSTSSSAFGLSPFSFSPFLFLGGKCYQSGHCFPEILQGLPLRPVSPGFTLPMLVGAHFNDGS